MGKVAFHLQTSVVSPTPSSLVFSVHVYHMLFFSNLQFIDWYMRAIAHRKTQRTLEA